MNEVIEQIRYYADALWRRRWQICGTSFLFAAIAWALVSLLPDQYKSTARIYVDTANVLEPLLRGLAVENNLTHQVQVMQQTLLSRPNLEEVTRMTDLDLNVNTPSAHEELINNLAGRISVEADRENLFRISFTDPDRKLARDVVQALTTIFVENNLGENRTDIDNAQEFLQRQIADYEAKLDEAEMKLARFKQENLQFLPGQTGLQQALASQEETVAKLRAAHEDALDRRDILRRAIAETPETMGQTPFGEGPPSDLGVRMMETEARLEALRAQYTDQHPDVVTMQRRLNSLRAEWSAQQQTPGPFANQPNQGAGSVPNPVYSELRIELVRQEADIGTLQAQLRREEEKLRSIERRIHLVPEVEAQLKRLTRDYDVIRENYETLRSRLESARISSDRQQQGSRIAFRLVEPAEMPLLPSGPNRPLLLGIGLVFSIAAGMGVAWLLAMITVTYGSVTHLEKDFDIPVIGSISFVEPEDAPNGTYRDMLKVGAAGTVMVAVLGALLFIESRFGLQSMRMPVFLLTGALGGIGAIILVSDRLRMRKRADDFAGSLAPELVASAN